MADEYNDSVTAAMASLDAHGFTNVTHADYTKGQLWRRDHALGGFDVVNITNKTGFVLATLEVTAAELDVVLKALESARKEGGE